MELEAVGAEVAENEAVSEVSAGTGMKLNVARDELVAKLGLVSRAVSTRGTVQVLSGILLSAEGGKIAQRERPSPARTSDDTIARQFGDGPGNRFDREPEMVGDVASHHGQLDVVAKAWWARRDAQQERRHLLPRILAAQQDHVSLGLLEPPHHRRHQFGGTPGVACWGPQFGAQPHLDSRVTNRGRRALMTVATFEAERIAGKVEGIDLAAPIVQQPVCSHGTCDELVEDCCAVAFDEDLVVPGKGAPRPLGEASAHSAPWRRCVADSPAERNDIAVEALGSAHRGGGVHGDPHTYTLGGIGNVKIGIILVPGCAFA